MASTPQSPSPAQPPAPQGAAYELRPLSLGEILDRIFVVYRSRFWLFCGLLAWPALIRLFLSGIVVAMAHFMRRSATPATISMVTIVVGYSASLISFIIFSVANAAVVRALFETYQGRDATIAGSLRGISGLWLRYVGIGAWQIVTSAGLYLLFVVPGVVLSARATARQDSTMLVIAGLLVVFGSMVAIPVGILLYLRYGLAIPASVVEDLPVFASVRRSTVLTRGTKGRLFVVLLVVFAMYLVVAALEAPLGYFTVMAALKHQEALWAQAINLVVSFLGTCLVGPIAALGLSLVYFDQRVRQEAWDLAWLLGDPDVHATPSALEPIEPIDAGPWVQPEQPRFITTNNAQPEPTGAIYEALVARPRTPANEVAPQPATTAEMTGDGQTPDTTNHAEGV